MKNIIITSLDISLMGGVEKSTSQLINLFNSKGHFITLISFFKPSENTFFNFDNAEIIYLNEYSVDINHGFKSKLISLFSFYKLLIYLKNRKDDYVVLSVYPRISLFFSFFFLNAKRIIACEHSSFHAHSKIICYLRLVFYKRLRCVINLTNHDQKIFQKAGLVSYKIPNYSDFKKELTPRDCESKKPLVCLAAGRMHPHKGFTRLVEIAKNLKTENIKFIIVGSGPEEELIRSLVKRFNLSDSVFLFPASKNLESFMTSADVFLMTSITEAAPLVILEAFAYSKPVIAYDCPVGPRELITDDINGFLVSNGNQLLFVNKLKSLLESHILYNNLAKGAGIYAKNNSSEYVYKLWEKIL